MRIVAVIAAFLALVAQPVLAQDMNKQSAEMTKATAVATDSDPARVAEARRLTAEALAADAEIKARNEAGQDAYTAASADYRAKLAVQQAAEARYRADLAAQQAAVAQYEADNLAWEARVKACRSGDYSQCGDQ